MNQEHSWHSYTSSHTTQTLKVDAATGLSSAQAQTRLEQHGTNTLPTGKKKTLVGMFFSQFRDFLVLLLIAAAIVSAGVAMLSAHTDEGLTDALVIMAIVIINAVLGVIQEAKASKAMEALKKMSIPQVEVLRDGRLQEISSELIVPGDVVILREGDYVPADMRLIESRSLKIDEASLTGESAPVDKQDDAIAAEAPLAERVNMAYAGTHVTYGRGQGVVVATGMTREIGRIAQLLAEDRETQTPLQRDLAGLGKLLGITALLICGVLFFVGVWQGGGPRLIDTPLGEWFKAQQHLLFEMFMTAVSLAVAAIPEGLPAIVTIVLALGVYRMSKRHAIVRKMPAVETLGCATYICTDKTGTLTENRMVVKAAATASDLLGRGASGKDRDMLLSIAVLCSDAHIEQTPQGPQRFGDPTELALVEYADKEGIQATLLRREHGRNDELPFDSSRKLMSTLNEIAGKKLMLVKGAPDVLLERCATWQAGDAAQPFDAQAKQKVHKRLEEMSAAALRVLAFAYKPMPREKLAFEDETDLVFAGLLGMIDPPREEAKKALDEACSAGIDTIMITGDNLLTAKAIASELGMFNEDDDAMSGMELAQINDEQLRDRVSNIRVFGRVWPEQKLRIVQALQDRGEIVAMTGDGVNDAPALKRANIGVAMGITGTDVAKETADVVLTDDNFATIVHAIEEGRVIFDNIRKFVVYLLSCNVGEIFVIFVPILMGLSSPLLPVQILLINLVTDGLPALALGMDPAEPDVMRRRPRKSKSGIVDKYYMGVIGWNALLITLAVTASYITGIVITLLSKDPSLAGKSLWEWMGILRHSSVEDHAIGMTMAFVTLGIDELWRAFSFRSQRHNIWQINPLGNMRLVGACGLSAAVVVATIMIEPLRNLFGNVLLDGREWAIALGLSLVPMIGYELWKLVRRIVQPQQ